MKWFAIILSVDTTLLYILAKKKRFSTWKIFLLTLNASYACTFYLKIEFGQFNNPLSERRPNKRKKKLHKINFITFLQCRHFFFSVWFFIILNALDNLVRIKSSYISSAKTPKEKESDENISIFFIDHQISSTRDTFLLFKTQCSVEK